MQLYIDTANIDEIRQAAALGVLDGVTTNPSLVAKESFRLEEHFSQLLSILGQDFRCKEFSHRQQRGLGETDKPRWLHSVKIINQQIRNLIVLGAANSVHEAVAGEQSQEQRVGYSPGAKVNSLRTKLPEFCNCGDRSTPRGRQSPTSLVQIAQLQDFVFGTAPERSSRSLVVVPGPKRDFNPVTFLPQIWQWLGRTAETMDLAVFCQARVVDLGELISPNQQAEEKAIKTFGIAKPTV